MGVVTGRSASATVFATQPGQIYRVLDTQGNLLSRIEWDGVSPYDAASVFGAGVQLQLEGPDPLLTAGDQA